MKYYIVQHATALLEGIYRSKTHCTNNRKRRFSMNVILDYGKPDLTTVMTTIVVINNGKVGLTDAEIDGFTYQKGLFLMLLARNDGIIVIRIPPAPP